MYPRKLFDFFSARTAQRTEPLPSVGISADAEFDWPPSAQDLEAFSVVHLRADDCSEVPPVVAGSADA